MTTLVLLPGMDGTGELFGPLVRELAALAPSLKVMVIDYPRDKPLGYAALTQLTAQKLPPDESLVLLGESFSGPIATHLAKDLKQRCLGLILCVTFVHSPIRLPLVTRAFARLIPFDKLVQQPNEDKLGTLSDELKPIFKAATASVAPAVWRARFQAALTVDERSNLRQLTCPSQYYRATHDNVIPARTAERIVKIQPRTQIIDFDAPHLLLQNNAVDAAKQIIAFMTLS